ncbi:hypothetical protein ACMU_14560 [Actibacterium mucosum KCTC 23349]|uniref:Uncharacterized protein n=1 Tax=Actibacterium mucosum KCTC 23349 TaxID=1454373 RepID=A0A037ZFS5_9RHOB|nr:hypothetical protein ACMU_14560 [Actibacterium mucosum KCTC 23349]
MVDRSLRRGGLFLIALVFLFSGLTHLAWQNDWTFWPDVTASQFAAVGLVGVLVYELAAVVFGWLATVTKRAFGQLKGRNND